MLVGLLRVFQVWHVLGSPVACLCPRRSRPKLQPHTQSTPVLFAQAAILSRPKSQFHTQSTPVLFAQVATLSIMCWIVNVIAARRLKLDFLYLKNVQLQSPPIVYCREWHRERVPLIIHSDHAKEFVSKQWELPQQLHHLTENANIERLWQYTAKSLNLLTAKQHRYC